MTGSWVEARQSQMVELESRLLLTAISIPTLPGSPPILVNPPISLPLPVGNTGGTGGTTTTVGGGIGSIPTYSTGHIDKAGMLDLLVVSPTDGVSVRFGNSQGEFGAPIQVMQSVPRQIFLADVNGDQMGDLILLDGSGWHWMRGNGDGSFQAAQAMPSVPAVTMREGDMNGDGKADLIYVSKQQTPIGSPITPKSTPQLTREQATTKIAAVKKAALQQISAQTRALHKAALQRAAHQAPTLRRVTLQRAAAKAAAIRHAVLLKAKAKIAALREAVSTGSAMQSAAVTSTAASPMASGRDTSRIVINVLMGNGDGSFNTVTTQASVTTGNVFLGDLNGDHILDVIVDSPLTKVVLPGNGNGTFGGPFGLRDVSGTIIAVDDFNADLVADLVLQAPSSLPGGFQPGSDAGAMDPAFGHVGPPALGTFPGMSTGSTPSGGQQALLRLGNGDFSFNRGTTISMPAGQVAIMDLNGDSQADVIASTVSSSGVESDVLLGRGDGTFGAPIPL